jgi:multicomponent Na+:H+ antiporter subunit E
MSALRRVALMFGLWIVLMGGGVLDLAVGALTAAAATLISLRLLAPQAVRLRAPALAGLALRFLRQSVAAGIDVARRAFDPALPLRLGYTRYAVGFRPGPGRNAFAALSSLLPGTVPVDEDGESLLYHCLDVGQPVAEQLAAEEAVLRRVIEEVAP